ncbi:MAG TPA: hypothetical protein VGQ58_00930 [Candidatus Limnocylindrales bacterium]|jgi:hypothetical protein|nr:hypothetical protein [Candidatus Limnocylindrales bacterium]
MRRLIALVGALVLVASLPAAASAARATRFTDHSVSVFCDLLTPTSGSGSAFFSAGISDEFGPSAFVEYWTTSEPIGQPALTTDFEAAPVVTWDGTTLSGSIPLRDSSGNSAGQATFSATLVPSGDPFVFDEQFKDGNHQNRFTGTSQPMDPSGTLQVGDATFSLDGCFGDETTVSVFATNPSSFVRHFTERTIGCELSNAAGDTAFLFFDVHEGDSFVDVFVDPVVGPDVAGFGGGTLVDGTFDADLTIYDPQTGELTGGTGSVHLVIASTGEPFEFLLRNATARFKGSGVLLDVEGSLAIDGHVFDLGACVFQDATGKEIFTFPAGPKPGGKVPSNDLPSGAKLLQVGDRTSVATKGASPDREAPYECLTFEDPETGDVFEVPVGFTVWYAVVGTGEPITIDTAGSDYDTVIAVYTADGAGGFTPVPGGCVDDVAVEPFGRTLQAAVTFDSVAGVTYYIQIGGFPESFPYGNLRVRVS